MTNILLATAYLAPVQYYSKLNRADIVTIELFEHYIKQSYRNRCIIAGPEGAQPLTLPVEKAPNHGSIKDVRLSDHGNWRRLHWNALQSSYMTSPFFEYYADDFAPFYEKKFDFLCDFNEELMLCAAVCSTSTLRANSVIPIPIVQTLPTARLICATPSRQSAISPPMLTSKPSLTIRYSESARALFQT